MVIDHVGGDRDPAMFRQVVADGVVDQVLSESFQKDWVACDRGGLQERADVDAGVLRGGLRFRGNVPCELGEVDRNAFSDTLLAAGEGEQAIDEPFVALVNGDQFGAQLTQ